MLGQLGDSVFNETTAFDEVSVLQENIEYLLNTLELEGLDIKPSSDADERIQEECCPGQPLIVYRIESSVSINIINQQAMNSLFELNLPFYEGDTVSKVVMRIAKENRAIKGMRNFALQKCIFFILLIQFAQIPPK